jgi:hypothetical protein
LFPVSPAVTTTGYNWILWKIRKEHDAPSFKLAHDVAEKYAEEFLDWGPLLQITRPLRPQSDCECFLIGRMFLNYDEPLSQFTRILKTKGESVQLLSILQQVPTSDYSEPLDLLAVVSPMKAEQVPIEPGYYLNDYLVFYTFIPIRNHDKLRRQGQDYEVQTVTPFIYDGERFYFKSITRRLLTS